MTTRRGRDVTLRFVCSAACAAGLLALGSTAGPIAARAAETPSPDSVAAVAAPPDRFSAAPLLETIWYFPLVGVQFSLQPVEQATFDVTLTTLLVVWSAEVGLRVTPIAKKPYAYGRIGALAVAGVGGGSGCSSCSADAATGWRADGGLGYAFASRGARRWFVEAGYVVIWENDELDDDAVQALRISVGYGVR